MTTPHKARAALSQQLIHFTDREPYLETFRRNLELSEGSALPVLAFHGVGGVGKTTLIERFAHELEVHSPPIPYARLNVENLKSITGIGREVLLRLRTDLESEFGLKFPKFDVLLAVLLAKEGGTPPSLVVLNPGLKNTFDFVMGLVGVPSDMIAKALHKQATKSETAERLLAKAGGREELLHLRERARREDPTLAEELIDRFADDLVDGLPARSGKACRGVLLLDTFETLWKGSDAGRSVQVRQLDSWLRHLARNVRQHGVLVVVAGRDKLWWAEESSDWVGGIETHLLGGLSRHDARIYLAKRAIGSDSYNDPETPLQTAILDTCCEDEESDGEVSCHPFYLALCADIVDNQREQIAGADPPVETFQGIPNDHVAQTLADRFLKSLPNERWELWVKELSLTPTFDEKAALDLDQERRHSVGRAGWKHLRRYSFLEPQAEAFFRLHKTMRDVLRIRVEDAADVHTWFKDHWTAREEPALAFFHRWSLEPEATLNEWDEAHEAAIKERRIETARTLLDDWSEIPLDGIDRRQLGDKLWARTHSSVASAIWKTPIAPLAPSLIASIAHYDAALRVYTEADFPVDWAMTQNNLGIAYSNLPTGDRGENLRRAIACYEAALRGYTEADFPADWAMTQNNLGNAYSNLPTGDRGENLRRAIAAYESALRVYTEADFPADWAMTQNNLGNAYSDLPTGDRGENLRRAIACYEAALRVSTEADFPAQWADTQYNLGLALRELGRLDESARAFECSARGYESVGDQAQADGAREEAEKSRGMKS